MQISAESHSTLSRQSLAVFLPQATHDPITRPNPNLSSDASCFRGGRLGACVPQGGHAAASRAGVRRDQEQRQARGRAHLCAAARVSSTFNLGETPISLPEMWPVDCDDHSYLVAIATRDIHAHGGFHPRDTCSCLHSPPLRNKLMVEMG